MYKRQTTRDLNFYDSANRLTIKTGTGNVGIGDDSPSEKVEVNGNIKASGRFFGASGSVVRISPITFNSGTAPSGKSFT